MVLEYTGVHMLAVNVGGAMGAMGEARDGRRRPCGGGSMEAAPAAQGEGKTRSSAPRTG